VEVIDLGLLQLAAVAPIRATSGTFAYQAPEQFVDCISGDDPNGTVWIAYPEKADVFTLGGIAYWLLTKYAPFASSPHKYARSTKPILDPEVESPSVWDAAAWEPAVRYVIADCLSLDPKHRPSLAFLLKALKP
jgi:serine/threonine protein kinase